MPHVSRRELVYLGLAFFAATFFYTAVYPQHSFQSDSAQYLKLAGEILHGEYSMGVFYRAPVFPLALAVPQLMGFSVRQAMFFVPLFFILLSLAVMFFFGKKFTGDGLTPLLILLSFPYLWRYGVYPLTDIALMVFSMLSMVYFFKGVHEEEKFMLHSGVALALAFLTKSSALLLLPVYALYLLLSQNSCVFGKRWFHIGFLSFVLVSALVSFIVFLESGSFGSEHLTEYVSWESTPWYSLLMYLVVVPWTLFFVLGFRASILTRKSNHILLMLSFIIIFLFFQLQGWKDMRLVVMLWPSYAALSSIGFLELKRFSAKTADMLFVVFFIVSIVEAQQMVVMDSSSLLWGGDVLGEYFSTLKGNNITVASEFEPEYLTLVSGKNVVRLDQSKSVPELKDSGADYAVLSIYSEFDRAPVEGEFHPHFLDKEIGFLGRHYSNVRVPSNYSFTSNYYHLFEYANNTARVKDVVHGNQTVFIVYQLL